MRNVPALVDAVTAKTAAELIVYAAGNHAAQRMQHDLTQIGVAARRAAAKAELELRGVRKLRGTSKAAVHGIEHPPQLRERRVDGRAVERRCRRLVRAAALQERGQFVVLRGNGLRLLAINHRDLCE